MLRCGMWLLVALGLLVFTSSDGHPVWIAPSQVVSVRTPVAREFEPQCHTVITTLSNTFCVREEPAEVVQRLEKTNG